jgi:hypothetical protein
MPRKNIAYGSILVLSLASCFLMSPAVMAEEIRCPPNIDLEGGVLTEKVIVPDGLLCLIENGEVRGNIEVGEGSEVVLGDVVIYGNVECHEGGLVALCGATVIGNIDESCTPAPPNCAF